MKKLYLSLALFICVFATTFAHSQEDFRRTLQYYVGLSSFIGDKHGDFKGDPVAVLSDGSAWKIHPKDSEKFSKWLANEILRPEARTSFYLLKREHKFRLYNHMRNESVRAMLAQYPTYPLMVIESETYNAGRPEKRVVLNDGTVWRIRKNFNHFNIGTTVHLGCNYETTRDGMELHRFFLISGIEREAVFEFVE